MNDLDKRQLKTLLRNEFGAMILLPIFFFLSLGLGHCMDRFVALYNNTLPRSEIGSQASWVACWFLCGLMAVMTYGTEFAEGTMPYLATRPVSHRRVFRVKIGCGLAVVLIISALGKVVSLLSHQGTSAHFLNRISVSFGLGWWYLGPCAYLAATSAILAIPAMVPAYAMAFILSFLVFWQGEWFSLLFLVLCPGLFILNERLAYYRRTTQWSEFK